MPQPCKPIADRSVAQPGSALDWGSRGRGFESRHSDQFKDLLVVTQRLIALDQAGVCIPADQTVFLAAKRGRLCLRRQPVSC
jgi:hypothetical protein